MHHDSDPHDALNNYLDARAGAPLPGTRAGDLDPELRDDVDRFFDLAERAGMTSADTRRPDMNTTLPASTVLTAPNRKPRRGVSMPAWTQHLHLLSTGLLIVAVIALTFAAFGPNGMRNGGNDGTGDGPRFNGAVPIATVPEGAEMSSIPYPTADECTVEVTREELIADLQEANVVTQKEQQRYERAIEPSADDAQAIMRTFREWQACGWDTQGYGFAYQIQLQTPWYTANHLPIFRGPSGENLRPVSDDTIVDYADVLLSDEDRDATQTARATPSPNIGTPSPWQAHNGIPIPETATPVTGGSTGRAYPTIFAEEIVITGPNTASASAYFVNPETREVAPATPDSVQFVNIDGQWLINDYHAGSRG